VTLPIIEAMRLFRVTDPFNHPDWIFELKHDGFRSLAYLENGKCRLVSRHSSEYQRFEALRNSFSQLKADTAILDGEVVCLDSNGHSQFNQLLFRRSLPAYYAFDLVWLDGRDLREFPLIERKECPRGLIEKSERPEILCAQFVEKWGTTLFREICERDLEGIVCKPKRSVYSKAKRAWLKVKNRDYTQAKNRQELFNPNRERSSRDSDI
jgi:bifunctional non-homologous end joining protein LigD